MLKAEAREDINKDKTKKGQLSYLIASVFLLISMLGFDFLFFASSGGYNLFDDTGFFNLELLYIFAGIFVFCLLLSLLFVFSKFLQNLVVSCFFGLFVLVFLNRYSSIDPEAFLGVVISENVVFNNYSHIIIPVFFALTLFIFLEVAKSFSVLLFAMIALSSFFYYSYNLYSNKYYKKQIATIFDYKTIQEEKEDNKKFVFISFDNLPSYSLMKKMDEEQSKIILGFLAKNEFEIYPNAFFEDDEKVKNIAKIHNFNQKKGDFLLKNIEIESYFNFNKLNDEGAFLSQSYLYSLFKRMGYDIVAYQGGDVNLCKVDNRDVADRCVDINTTNTDISNKNLLFKDRLFLLLSQWVNDSGLGFDVWELNNAKYADVFAINSLEQLKEAFDDIAHNKKQTFYFLDINLPGELYVFDSFCRLKSKENWIVSDDKKINIKSKEKAFFEQTTCLFATLNGLMDQTKKDNIVFVLSSSDNVLSAFGDKGDFVSNFMAQKLTTFAISDPVKNKFEYNLEVCPNYLLLKKYLFKKNDCALYDLGLGGASKTEVYTELNKPFLENKDVVIESFVNFYNEFYGVSNSE